MACTKGAPMACDLLNEATQATHDEELHDNPSAFASHRRAALRGRLGSSKHHIPSDKRPLHGWLWNPAVWLRDLDSKRGECRYHGGSVWFEPLREVGVRRLHELQVQWG